MLAQPEDTDDESDEEEEDGDTETNSTNQSIYSNLIKTYCTLL